MTNRGCLTILALAVVAGAAPLTAQDRDTTAGEMGMPEMMGMMQMCPMMAAMGQGPQAALAHGDSLELSDAQRRRLETLRAEAREAAHAAMTETRTARQELRAALERERVDSAAVRTGFRKMADAHARMALAAVTARRGTREVLSPEQREELAQLARRQRMEHMRGMMDHMGMMGDSARGGRMGMMHMMMEQCPMMRGMMGEKEEGT